jgi:hypothetical protein
MPMFRFCTLHLRSLERILHLMLVVLLKLYLIILFLNNEEGKLLSAYVPVHDKESSNFKAMTHLRQHTILQ